MLNNKATQVYFDTILLIQKFVMKMSFSTKQLHDVKSHINDSGIENSYDSSNTYNRNKKSSFDVICHF